MSLLLGSDEPAIAVRDALLQLNVPVFVGRMNGNSLELGTLERRITPSMRHEAQDHLRRRGIQLSVKIVRRNAAKLRKVRSLEALMAKTGQGTLVFDRTSALGRSEAIVDLGSRLRQRLGLEIRGLFCQSERRTLFVVLSRQARSVAVDAAARERVRAEIIAAEQEWREAVGANAFQFSVRVGFEVPAGAEVIAVDRKTVRTAFADMMRRPIKSKLGAAVLGSIVGAAITVPAVAADLPMGVIEQQMPVPSDPAVDEPNVSLSLLSGTARDPVLFDHLWAGLNVKATLPLGERFGAQIDLGAATDQYYGAALHLFARDPAMGLVGIVGSAENQYGVSMNRIGAEVEYYLNDKFTIGARVGYQGGTAPNGAFGRLDVKFYPDPNLKLSAGAELQPSFAVGRLGFEWRPAVDALPGMSVSADASATSTGNYRATFGLHFQLGGSETLVDRDRKSDPDSAIWNQIDTTSAAYGGGAQ